MTDMNSFIRGMHKRNVASIGSRTVTVVSRPPSAADATPAGHAGAGTGSPPADVRSGAQKANDAIRQAAGRKL